MPVLSFRNVATFDEILALHTRDLRTRWRQIDGDEGYRGWLEDGLSLERVTGHDLS